MNSSFLTSPDRVVVDITNYIERLDDMATRLAERRATAINDLEIAQSYVAMVQRLPNMIRATDGLERLVAGRPDPVQPQPAPAPAPDPSFQIGDAGSTAPVPVSAQLNGLVERTRVLRGQSATG